MSLESASVRSCLDLTVPRLMLIACSCKLAAAWADALSTARIICFCASVCSILVMPPSIAGFKSGSKTTKRPLCVSKNQSGTMPLRRKKSVWHETTTTLRMLCCAMKRCTSEARDSAAVRSSTEVKSSNTNACWPSRGAAKRRARRALN